MLYCSAVAVWLWITSIGATVSVGSKEVLGSALKRNLLVSVLMIGQELKIKLLESALNLLSPIRASETMNIKNLPIIVTLLEHLNVLYNLTAAILSHCYGQKVSAITFSVLQ